MIRCLGQDKLFPAAKPVLCDEKNDDPFYEIQCCRSDFCNKHIHISIPGNGGEEPYSATNKKQNQKQNHQKATQTFTIHHPPTTIITFITIYAHINYYYYLSIVVNINCRNICQNIVNLSNFIHKVCQPILIACQTWLISGKKSEMEQYAAGCRLICPINVFSCVFC